MGPFVTTVVFTLRASQYEEAKVLFSKIEKVIPMQPGCIYFQLHLGREARLPQLQAPEQNTDNDPQQLNADPDEVISFFKRDVWEDSELFDQHVYSDIISSHLSDIFRLARRLPECLNWERISTGSAARKINNNFNEERNNESDGGCSEVEDRCYHDDGAVVTVSYRTCEPDVKFDFQQILSSLAMTCCEKQLAEMYDIHASLDPAEPNLYMEYSIWYSEESFEAHFQDPDVMRLSKSLLRLGNGVPKVEVFRKFTFCE